MKQENLFVLILIIFFSLFGASPAPVWGDNLSAADASLATYEKSLGRAAEDQPDGSLPRWKASLAEIQQSSAVLLETNSKLNEESRQIKGDLDALHVQINALRAAHAQMEQQIEGLRVKGEENTDAVQVPRLKEILADRYAQIRAQKEQAVAIRSRAGSMESRRALMRLRVAGLEVEKRSLEVDVKARDEAALVALRHEIGVARDKLVRAEQQISVLREKTVELNGIDNPYIPQVKDIVIENGALRERMAALQVKRREQEARGQDLAGRKAKAETDRNVQRVKKLLSDRAAFEAQLRDNSAMLDELRRKAAEPAVSGEAFSAADIDRLKKHNQTAQEIIGNLRENVALLEYKVTTLQRYQDRNGPARK